MDSNFQESTSSSTKYLIEIKLKWIIELAYKKEGDNK